MIPGFANTKLVNIQGLHVLILTDYSRLPPLSW
jgi:hypothetical protein